MFHVSDFPLSLTVLNTHYITLTCTRSKALTLMILKTAVSGALPGDRAGMTASTHGHGMCTLVEGTVLPQWLSCPLCL